MRPTRDLAAGLIGLVVSIWLFAMTWDLPRSSFVPIGPEFYPRIVLALTALLSIGVIAGGLRSRRRPDAGAATPGNYRLVALSFAAFGLYVLLLPNLGFRLATLIFVVGLQVLLDPPRSRGRWWTAAIVGIASSLGIFFVFERYLSVLLPRGSWTGF